MKLESELNTFLKNEVNLNETRYKRAEAGINTMSEFLKNDEVFGKLFIKVTTQGSFRQETIIKPCSSDQDFDVDLLFEMKEVKEWQPKDYLANLAARFKKTDRYKDKVDTRGKNRCVTIDYEDDFHIDIIPCITRGSGKVIMNKSSNEYESTDGDGYAEWFEGQNKITTKKHLIKVVRLYKYIRDSESKFEAKSILLTTLLGQQISSSDNSSLLYPDLSTSFLNITERLNKYLQANPVIPVVVNPVLLSENFNRHWDQKKYDVFRSAVDKITRLSHQAYNESDQHTSIKLWREIFGENFGTTGITESSAPVIKRDSGEQFLSDFNINENLKYPLKINATITQDGWSPFYLLGNKNPLRKKAKIKFFIENNVVPTPYSVKWKIKNKGNEATHDLRGEILDDHGREERVEHTRYQGSHYAECYIIKDGQCVAKSKITVPIGSI